MRRGIQGGIGGVGQDPACSDGGRSGVGVYFDLHWVSAFGEVVAAHFDLHWVAAFEECARQLDVAACCRRGQAHAVLAWVADLEQYALDALEHSWAFAAGVEHHQAGVSRRLGAAHLDPPVASGGHMGLEATRPGGLDFPPCELALEWQGRELGLYGGFCGHRCPRGERGGVIEGGQQQELQNEAADVLVSRHEMPSICRLSVGPGRWASGGDEGNRPVSSDGVCRRRSPHLRITGMKGELSVAGTIRRHVVFSLI